MPDHLLTTLQSLHSELAAFVTELQDTHASIQDSINNTHTDLITLSVDVDTQFDGVEDAIAAEQNLLHNDHVASTVAVANVFTDVEAIGAVLNHASYGLVDHQASLLDQANGILSAIGGVLAGVQAILADLTDATHGLAALKAALNALSAEHATIVAAIATLSSDLATDVAAVTVTLAALSADLAPVIW